MAKSKSDISKQVSKLDKYFRYVDGKKACISLLDKLKGTLHVCNVFLNNEVMRGNPIQMNFVPVISACHKFYVK